MRSAEFDSFVEALQSTVGRVQTLIAARQEGRLERLVQLDHEGRAEMLSWSFVIDDTESGAESERVVRLPLAVLRPHLMSQLSEVILEFDAVIAEEVPPRPRTKPGRVLGSVTGSDAGVEAEATSKTRRARLALLFRRGWWPLRRRLHRIRIRLWGPQPGSGEIFVDDRRLKTLPEGSVPPQERAEAEGAGR